MSVTFDASILVYVLNENANPPIDPATGAPVTFCKERVEYLLETLQKDGTKIIIPTPSLAEVLVRGQQAAPEWLRILNSSRHFRIASFDERAAIEHAALQASKIGARNAVPRQKAKFDDQIVAIAAVEGSTIIYSDDEHIKTAAKGRFTVIGVAELPLRPEERQGSLPLTEGAKEQNPENPNWGQF